MRKLNLGCGSRIADGWTNIDFHSSDARVLRSNFLVGLPFPANHFDVVYSSHVLEHFTQEQGDFLIGESYRILKPGGIIRIVVPDLESTCREYFRILALDDSDPSKLSLYTWIKIELLDQLVRTAASGSLGPFAESIMKSEDQTMIMYLRSRTESCGWSLVPKVPLAKRLTRITRQKITSLAIYSYLAFIKRLVPKPLRQVVFDNTSIGERHRWMYDRYGLNLSLQSKGFTEVCFLPFNTSRISGLWQDRLDCNPDGSPYKNVSLYCEACKA